MKNLSRSNDETTSPPTNDPMKEETNTPAVVNQQIDKTQSPKKTIKDLLNSEEFKQQIANALPKHLTPERFARVALTAINRTPKLAECTQTSLFQCLLDLSAMGLEPDGRRAHLIPFRNNRTNTTTCTLLLDYKGIVELAQRSGVISNIHADSVCENDEFEYDRGVVVKHKIDFKKDRGEAYAYYCIVRFKDGTEKAEVMSVEDVEAIRRRSKSANDGPWVTDFSEMAKKTVFKRVSKWITLSPEIRENIEKADAHFDFVPTKTVTATPQFTLEALENPIVNKAGDLSDEEREKSNEAQASIYEGIKESTPKAESSPKLEAKDIPWGDEDKIPMVEAENKNYRAALLLELSKRNIKEAVFMKTMRDKFGITKKMIVELTDAEAKEALAEAKLEQML